MGKISRAHSKVRVVVDRGSLALRPTILRAQHAFIQHDQRPRRIWIGQYRSCSSFAAKVSRYTDLAGQPVRPVELNAAQIHALRQILSGLEVL